MNDETPVNAADILQTLIRFDTTNPPGNERACIDWIRELLDSAGIETAVFAKDSGRPNLVARLRGRRSVTPLMLYGHVDVVGAGDIGWTHPPFSGKLADGCIWGRGALDMKGCLAMMLAAILKVRRQGGVPPVDVLFCALSDEEAGGDAGAGFMVEHHPEEFKGVRYAVGEFGGFPLYIGNTCFYLIQTGEKEVCWMKGRLKGKGGHGSQWVRGSALARLGRLISRLENRNLPVHVTPQAKAMMEAIARHAPIPVGWVLKLLMRPAFTDLILRILGEKGEMFDPLVHNTVNLTVVRGGDKVNVIPSTVDFEMDGRILPGQTAEGFIREIQDIAGNDLELEIVRNDPGPVHTDMGLFPLLKGILEELHPGSHPVPILLAGMTDARYFSKLGIQTYGFTPLRLPPSFPYGSLIHAVDERVPATALEFGVNALERLILTFG